MAHVKVGVATFQVRPKAVVRLCSIGHKVLTVAGVVNGMRIGVIERRLQAFDIGYSELCLKRMVVRIRRRLEEIDVAERRGVRDLRGKRSMVEWMHAAQAEGRGRVGAVGGWVPNLVDVPIAEQPMPLRADVADLENGVPADLLLDVEIVVFHVRRADVTV